MSQYHTQISRYFRQSLIDADRLCPEDKDILPVLGPDKKQDPKDAYLAFDQSIWQQGRINPNLAAQILDARQGKNKEPLQQSEIVIFPRVDYLKYQGGAHDQRKRTVLLPLVVFANLHRDGTLQPTKKAPWIPRIWIGPSEESTEPFTEMAKIDEFFTQHPFEGVEDWPQLTAYCARLLCHATGTPFREPSAEQASTQVAEILVSDDFSQSAQCLFQLDTPVVGAKANLLKLLDFLIDRKHYPKLYQAYSERKNARLSTFENKQDSVSLAQQHLGQMSGEFPLSVKQRNALHHFIEQVDGEVLAVNGPPGTGKTTLLRSVVANLWTQAALNQSEPPLIVATSNNNQAVTNILESFARIDEDGLDESLKGRWLPEVDSYGLYFCSSAKANSKNPYRYAGPKGEGCMEAWQTQTFITEAQSHFLNQVGQWQQSECQSVDDALKALHREMLIVKKQISQGFDFLENWQSALSLIDNKYGSLDGLRETITENKVALEEQAKAYQQEKQRLDELYGLWESRSWWVRCFIWLPHIRKQEERKTARLLNQWDRHIEVSSDDQVESYINQQMTQIATQTSGLQKELLAAEKALDHFLTQQGRLECWMAPAKHLKLFSKTKPEQVQELNDRYYRFRLFKLATHYFEARWLKETKSFVESNDADKKSPFKLLRKLRRYAKLTPCFVSTFYMVPSTFMAGEYKDNVWQDLPQLEEIDLLIVDEAGQALPDVSAASFALAKKALIVGDTDQIEPVWSIPAGVDRSNLALYGLLGDDADYESWLDSGLLVSSGNVMRVAQRQCRYHQIEQLQRGLYLTEHRRCFNDIVGYCNDLVYQGVLEPLRGNAKHDVPWGTMTMEPVVSASRSYGGSRGNPGEAQVIADWVFSQSKKIVEYARQQDEKLKDKTDAVVLSKAVGIITPFSKQAALIRSELTKHSIENITVGTVHSLQGDERFIVLFSSVYGENDKDSGKFYDAGSNMLNVAVSRAKDSLIVFGDPNVFGMSAKGSPSGMLRQRLALAKESNKLGELEGIG
ncbi:AAA domain-containing protein [Photobacterium sp. SP02]|uniref:AAA domain-containing protein n=1 Tax=Photobacterium sp. SP02 TaxID=3032280 RepID=UPI003144D91B